MFYYESKPGRRFGGQAICDFDGPTFAPWHREGRVTLEQTLGWIVLCLMALALLALGYYIWTVMWRMRG